MSFFMKMLGGALDGAGTAIGQGSYNYQPMVTQAKTDSVAREQIIAAKTDVSVSGTATIPFGGKNSGQPSFDASATVKGKYGSATGGVTYDAATGTGSATASVSGSTSGSGPVKAK